MSEKQNFIVQNAIVPKLTVCALVWKDYGMDLLLNALQPTKRLYIGVNMMFSIPIVYQRIHNKNDMSKFTSNLHPRDISSLAIWMLYSVVTAV